MLNVFGGPRALGKNQKILNFWIFFTNKPYFFKLNLNSKYSKLSFEVHNTLETQNFENFEFFYNNIDWNSLPSSTKLKDLKMAFQVIFVPKI